MEEFNMKKSKKKFLELCALRERCELKQSDLALLIGCSESNYGAKERGDVTFTLEEAFVIKDAINKILDKKQRNLVSIEEIFLR